MKLFDRIVVLFVVITSPFIALIILRLYLHWKERRKLKYEAKWFFALWTPEMREYQLALPNNS
jgi:hypothetical protein